MSNSWQGYADLDGPYVKVTLGQFSPEQATTLQWEAPIAQTTTRVEGTRTESNRPLDLPVDVAQALYQALDRIFGNHHETGVADVLREALNYERQRVDHALTRGPIVLSGQPVAPEPVG